MSTRLFSIEELAERWHCHTRTISKYMAEGKISPCDNTPKVLFREDYIDQLELGGLKLDKMSSLERKKLENRIKELEEENKAKDSILIKLGMLGAESLNVVKK